MEKKSRVIQSFLKWALVVSSFLFICSAIKDGFTFWFVHKYNRMPTSYSEMFLDQACSKDQLDDHITGNNSVNNDYLWKVSRNDLSEPSYLFGTIHVPASLVLDSISQETKKVFLESDGVFGEIHSPLAFWAYEIFVGCFHMTGHTLDDVLGENLIGRVRSYFKNLENISGQHIYESEWITLHPKSLIFYLREARKNALISSSKKVKNTKMVDDNIKGNEANKKSTSFKLRVECVSPNLIFDNFLMEFSARIGKTTDGVEKAKDRCYYRKNMPYHLGTIGLDYALRDMEKSMNLNSVIFGSRILKDYVNDSSPSTEVYEGGSTVKHPYTREQINQYIKFEYDELIERNRKMSSRLSEILTASPKSKFFFAFGYGHFQDKGSVNEFLQEMGFTVERVLN